MSGEEGVGRTKQWQREADLSYWELIENAFDEVDIYSGPAAFMNDLQPLPAAVQHLLTAHWCQSEINNGGFDQLFYNPTGVLAPEAEAGFRAIGLPAVADLVGTAIARFGPDYPRDQDARVAAMRALPNDGSKAYSGLGRCFGDLDDRFYELCAEFDSIADDYAKQATGD